MAKTHSLLLSSRLDVSQFGGGCLPGDVAVESDVGLTTDHLAVILGVARDSSAPDSPDFADELEDDYLEDELQEWYVFAVNPAAVREMGALSGSRLETAVEALYKIWLEDEGWSLEEARSAVKRLLAGCQTAARSQLNLFVWSSE